jgi:hypothetical protein
MKARYSNSGYIPSIIWTTLTQLSNATHNQGRENQVTFIIH